MHSNEQPIHNWDIFGDLTTTISNDCVWLVKFNNSRECRRRARRVRGVRTEHQEYEIEQRGWRAVMGHRGIQSDDYVCVWECMRYDMIKIDVLVRIKLIQCLTAFIAHIHALCRQKANTYRFWPKDLKAKRENDKLFHWSLFDRWTLL